MRAPASQIATIAPTLLGWHLTANGVTLRLTEVEAYQGQGEDPASHAHRGRTNRNAVMFGPAGHAYVYFVFGMHWCLNITCGRPGEAAAVLLRAGAVVDGLDAARARRPAVTADRDLARGPARLVMTLGVDVTANGTSLVDGSGPILLAPPARPVDQSAIVSGPRVGVAAAPDVPWRFWLDGDPTVSPYRRHVPRVARKPASGGSSRRAAE
jgi:DNA-3-methyladenine glycosylase